jgi:hypothetical protein
MFELRAHYTVTNYQSEYNTYADTTLVLSFLIIRVYYCHSVTRLANRNVTLCAHSIWFFATLERVRIVLRTFSTWHRRVYRNREENWCGRHDARVDCTQVERSWLTSLDRTELGPGRQLSVFNSSVPRLRQHFYRGRCGFSRYPRCTAFQLIH